MTDTHVAELLDELTPSYDDRSGDWERVAAAADATRRRMPYLRLGLLAATIAAAAALVKTVAMPQRAHERVVDSLLRELFVPQDRDRDAQKLAVAATVDGFDLPTEVADVHCLPDPGRPDFL